MRILLIGEYSRLHNSLKEGLQNLGHEVTIIGSGDGFKKYPIDIEIKGVFNNSYLKKIRTLIYRLTNIDLDSIIKHNQLKKELKKLGQFDITQLISENSLGTIPKYEIKSLAYILKHTKKLFILSCGIDYYSIKYMVERKFKYSFLDPFLEGKSNKKKYQFILSQLEEEHVKLHNFAYSNCNGILASDMDYHLPLKGNKKYLGLMPNPINTKNIEFIPNFVNDKIKIFHGVNIKAQHKKGNKYFFEALEIINKKYSDKIEIHTTYSVPYEEYIKLYNDCHILLDQVYGYDQGFNALEAMAKGKVVFTGAEKEWLEYYNLKEDTVAINATPNTKQIVDKLEWLILNPQKISEISKNARAFIEKEHNYIEIAKKYINTWTTAN
ncbi:glycosyltransferase [Pontimicrobium sp. IMCC45349]|uniref:glycosyltransferase family protein n=1 Tax=Pontimicrobium sp. IMCC45349 TaxID=3391574 RepID=UPI0039A0843A